MQNLVLDTTGAQFDLQTPQGQSPLRRVPGKPMSAMPSRQHLLCKRASLTDIQTGLQNGAYRRALASQTLNPGVQVLDDSHNANVAWLMLPWLLTSFSGHPVLILGDMAELGKKALYHELWGNMRCFAGLNACIPWAS